MVFWKIIGTHILSNCFLCVGNVSLEPCPATEAHVSLVGKWNMAKVTLGDFRGKAERSHAASLVSHGILILGEASHIGAEPHGSRCACGQPQQASEAQVPFHSEYSPTPATIGFSDDPPQFLFHFFCA
jgi:hypothetical protein